MPDQTQQREEQQRQQQEQNANQTATQARTQDLARQTAREAVVPQSTQEIRQRQRQDEAALSQRWPELKEHEEQDLKESFQNIAEQARDTRAAIDNYEKQVPSADKDHINDARLLVDEEMRGARNDVNEARKRAERDGGQVAPDVEERINMRQEKLEHLEKSITRDTANDIENTRRQELLEQTKGSDMKKALWELSGRELENRELADFRRENGLPDEALVMRENELFAANLSLKKVIDNIKKMTEDEGADASAGQQQNETRALSSAEQRELKRQDDAALAERWPELKQASEDQLKQAFRDVSEQADQTREAIAAAEKKAKPDISHLQEMPKQVDEEMRGARSDVVEAREEAENKGGKVSNEMKERFGERAERLGNLEREAKREGETARAYLENAGLDKAVDRHRAILEDNVEFHKQELERAKGHGKESDQFHQAAAELELSQKELRDLDRLLKQDVSKMRPDLVEARQNEERLRIDMTDFSHRTGEIEHTIKAEIYREAMQKAFPDADVSMREYRSATSNKLVDEKEFAEKLERILEAREEEIRKRREEELY